jgi:hypothetical protein
MDFHLGMESVDSRPSTVFGLFTKRLNSSTPRSTGSLKLTAIFPPRYVLLVDCNFDLVVLGKVLQKNPDIQKIAQDRPRGR